MNYHMMVTLSASEKKRVLHDMVDEMSFDDTEKLMLRLAHGLRRMRDEDQVDALVKKIRKAMSPESKPFMAMREPRPKSKTASKKLDYHAGDYYVISTNGTPSLIGKVIRKRGATAVISIVNGCWHATFDAIGMHSKSDTLYLVESKIDLPADIVQGFEISLGTEVIPYVERALDLYHQSLNKEES